MNVKAPQEKNWLASNMVRDERVCASGLLPQAAVLKAAAACLVYSSVYWHAGIG